MAMTTAMNSPVYSLAAYVPIDGDRTGMIDGKLNPTWRYIESTDINDIVPRLADVLESDNPEVWWHFCVNGIEVDPDNATLATVIKFAMWRLGAVV
jgi:hypothetical protein